MVSDDSGSVEVVLDLGVCKVFVEYFERGLNLMVKVERYKII